MKRVFMAIVVGLIATSAVGGQQAPNWSQKGSMELQNRGQNPDSVQGFRQYLLCRDGSRQLLLDHHVRRAGAHRCDECQDGRWGSRQHPDSSASTRATSGTCSSRRLTRTTTAGRPGLRKRRGRRSACRVRTWSFWSRRSSAPITPSTSGARTPRRPETSSSTMARSSRSGTRSSSSISHPDTRRGRSRWNTPPSMVIGAIEF